MSVPKAELHVHVEGAASPDLVQRIAARNGIRVPDGVIGPEGKFVWRDFLDFLNTYDAATSVIRTGEDYRDIVYEYLVKCAAEGAIYVELTASADHASQVGPHARPLAIVHARDEQSAARAEDALRAAFTTGDGPVEPPPLVERIGSRHG